MHFATILIAEMQGLTRALDKDAFRAAFLWRKIREQVWQYIRAWTFKFPAERVALRRVPLPAGWRLCHVECAVTSE